jgi:regulation of enolase protein 1 (concanavalin A-like superfamily)
MILSLALLPLSALWAFGQTRDSVRVPGFARQLYWENGPVKFTQSGGTLQIRSGAKTDMFRDPNVTYNTDNAPKLLFRADDNFVLTVMVEQDFKSKWDGGALVLKQDSLNWVKFCFEKDYLGFHRVVSVVTKNVSDDCNHASLSSNQVYYKLAKADNVLTLYYSTDATHWVLIRHLQFDLRPGFSVGFLSQSPTGPGCEVRFSHITYRAIKIKDPYLGE